MRYKLLLGAVVAGLLGIFGIMRDFGTTQALIPSPVQPFGPDQQGGMSTTQLGQPIFDYAITEISRGERFGQSWVYSAPGFQVTWDADIPDETVIGNVILREDVVCDSAGDADLEVFAQSSSTPPNFVPFDWKERTTAVGGTPDAFLLTVMPPFTFLLRQEADLDNVWLFGAIAYPTNWWSINTVYSSVPWSPGSGTSIATMRFLPLPAQFPQWAVCEDSPRISTSITSVYTNPSLEYDSNSDGVDDAAGLYPRWTAFQSDPDDRKPLKSPPSIASDTGYVERTIDLQCYWLDADGAPDGNGDGYIDPSESIADDDMPAGADDDYDCLIDAAFAQPGQPTDAVDALTGMLCPVLPYSEEPLVIQYDTAADQDCDGLVDGIEAAWGSNPTLADTDADGAADFVEMFQFTNPTMADTDGDGLLDRPDDDYVSSAAGAAEGVEAVNADDNCPAVANPDQTNNDGQRRNNGSMIPMTWASNPNGDKAGDACDQDDDNDQAVDVAEWARTPTATNSLDADTDGDRCQDGAEGYLGSDPLSAASRCPYDLSPSQLKSFRACRWNLPPDGYGSGSWDTEYDGSNDGIEWDADGDGISCQSGGTVTDFDNDNGTGIGAAAPSEFVDAFEIKGYGLNPASRDTDGDGCEDWIEIVDVNGDRKVNIIDVMYVAKRAFGISPASDSDRLLDVDKNGIVNIGDTLLAGRNSNLVKPHAPCLSEG